MMLFWVPTGLFKEGLGTPKRWLPRISLMLTDWPGGQSVSLVGLEVREASQTLRPGALAEQGCVF